MICYFVDTNQVQDRWHRTRREAHAHAKQAFRHDPAVIQYRIPKDHNAIVALLNGELERKRLMPLAAWELSPRGGLKKLDVNEL